MDEEQAQEQGRKMARMWAEDIVAGRLRPDHMTIECDEVHRTMTLTVVCTPEFFSMYVKRLVEEDLKERQSALAAP